MKRILVLGGGAAGLAAAIAAAESAPGVEVVLAERNARVGKKLLATGNGRCNLSNEGIAENAYFSADRAGLRRLLSAVEHAAPLGWLRGHGLYTRTDEAGRLYPYSNQAADVLNLLLAALEKSGVQVRTECTVASLSQKKNGYLVQFADGTSLAADSVVCAMGGAAGPQFGTDGFALDFARQLGCRMEPAYPCLVPLACRKAEVAGLSGIRAKADVTLFDGMRPLGTESGEVQFTDYGLSGIAVMQLSGRLAPRRGPKQPEMELNLFPHLSEAELADLLQRRAPLFDTAADCFTGLLNRKLGLAVWKACALGKENRPADSLSPADWRTLAHGLQHWRFTQLSPIEWKHAQTTGGGIALGELENDFSLKGCRGLYFVGETVDCAGSCGGFNLHWAFGSGLLAGQSAARLCSAASEPKRRPAKGGSSCR